MIVEVGISIKIKAIQICHTRGIRVSIMDSLVTVELIENLWKSEWKDCLEKKRTLSMKGIALEERAKAFMIREKTKGVSLIKIMIIKKLLMTITVY